MKEKMKQKMKQFMELVTKSKKNIALTAGSVLMVTILIGGGIFYAANAGGKDVKAAPVVKTEPEETEETKIEFTDKDVKDVVAGINDHYILQNAKDIDYNHKVSYDKKYVEDIKPDAKKVDLKKPGTYPVTYTVTVKTEALRTYLEGKTDNTNNTSDSDKKGTGTDKKEDVSKDTEKKEDTTKPDTTGKEDTTDVVIDTEITVVEKDKAEDLANKGEVVWGDKNEPVKKEDGTKVEEKEETPETTPTPEKPATDKGNSGSTDTGNGGSAASNASGSGNRGENAEPPAQVHTHNWVTQTSNVHHDATGHYEEQVVQAAYDEPVYTSKVVCGCGAVFDSDGQWEQHSIDGCAYGYSVQQVPNGSVHHEAITQSVWVQDSAAWEETVTSGSVCSGCGATK